MRTDFGVCIGRVFICIFVICLVIGCTTTKNMLSHLKFWTPKGESGKTMMTQKELGNKTEVRAIAKGNPESHYLLGQHLQQRGKHLEAIAEFTKTIKIDPMSAKAYNLMGISYDSLGDYDNATKCYEVALEISPISEYYNNLGYNLIMKGDYEGAIEVLTTATNLAPGNDKIRNNLALAYSNKGKHDSALGEIRKTSDPDGNSLALAEALLKTGKPLIASELVAQASRFNPVFEQKLSENDQHVIKIARTLKEKENSRVVAVQEVHKSVVNLKVLKKSDKEAIKIVRKVSTGNKVSKVQTFSAGTESIAPYPPDFMFNRHVKIVTTSSDDQKPRVKQEPSVQLIGKLFPARYVSGTHSGNHTTRTSWF